MNRQITALAVCGGLLLLLCCGVGFFLFSAWSEKTAMKEARDQKTAELERIYAAEVFPSNENIAQYKKDAEVVSEWRGIASNLFRRGEVVIDETLSPSRFKRHLMEVVQKLNAQFRTPVEKGREGRTSRKFGFDFDRYLGDTLPKAEDVPRLSRQLEMIRLLCAELRAVGVAEITDVTREKFDQAEDKDKANREEKAPKPRRKDRHAARAAKTVRPIAPEASAEKPFSGKERFVFSFKARPDVLIGSLNRLAAMDLFAVVAEVEIHKLDSEGKPGDMLKDFIQKRLSEERIRAEQAAEEHEALPATLPAEPPKRRVVTDPELDPPSAVKVVIDVYTF